MSTSRRADKGATEQQVIRMLVGIIQAIWK